MSDIDMRFDGIFLLAALALGATIYLLVAMVAATIALFKGFRSGRAWGVARGAGLMAVGSLVLFGVLFAYWIGSGTAHYGTDWLDLMTIPWVMLFAVGCWGLIKSPSETR
jgi:hypothetical protein